MQRILTIGMLAIICIFTANVCLALKWGHNLVSVGDTKYEVLKRCGNPVFKEFLGVEKAQQFTRKRRSSKSSYEKVEVWVYDEKSLGRGSFDYQLIFVGLELVEIKHISP